MLSDLSEPREKKTEASKQMKRRMDNRDTVLQEWFDYFCLFCILFWTLSIGQVKWRIFHVELKELHISEAVWCGSRRLPVLPVKELPVSGAPVGYFTPSFLETQNSNQQQEGAERKFSLAPRRREKMNEGGGRKVHDRGDNEGTGGYRCLISSICHHGDLRILSCFMWVKNPNWSRHETLLQQEHRWPRQKEGDKKSRF